MFRVNSMGRLC